MKPARQWRETMDAESIYLDHIDQPYGKYFAATVGRFQEGFLRDKTDDLDEAFALAVDAAVRSLTVIKLRAEIGRPA